ncbi:MAG: hypothetical protein QOJ42_7330 [Acidobacteriaceae bacterium]|nr:hypothetical protein [Acidobacteriaceae bacterium]
MWRKCASDTLDNRVRRFDNPCVKHWFALGSRRRLANGTLPFQIADHTAVTPIPKTDGDLSEAAVRSGILVGIQTPYPIRLIP